MKNKYLQKVKSVLVKGLLPFYLFTFLLLSCGLRQQTATAAAETAEVPVGPTFCADSAYAFCEQQCAFGPRIMNSEAHDRCASWIANKFQRYGLSVTTQHTNLKGYDGTMLRATNIIASHRPELSDRILVCAHWDSRPWADNDPDPANHHTPVMAANDGASGVAVMLELARLLTSSSSPSSSTPEIGVDFICFDAEDWGTPQWSTVADAGNTWALGSQYWAANPHVAGYKARYGILLDMVGGQGAMFFKEGLSLQYAPAVVDRVWHAAQVVGFGSMFPNKPGTYITDDHAPVNTIAKIPCIDIIPYYLDCEQSTFGPTWHTIHDDMEHIDRTTLQAVGQTLIQVLYSE